jgi:hypothetical protein
MRQKQFHSDMLTQSTIYFLLILILLFAPDSWSQHKKKVDSLGTAAYLDSMLVDHNLANYSIRVFGNFKSQRFNFNNEDASIEYSPNNRSGVGIGFASKKLLIDIAFNIKSKDKEPTNRFDMRVNYKLKKHYFDFFFQHYKGFNVTSSENNLENFRSDIQSVASGLNYLYLFNEDHYQVGTLRSVISERSRTDFSYGVGGFALTLSQKGDRPLFDSHIYKDENIDGVNSVFGIGGGLLTGVGGFFSMGANFYSSISVNAGLGLMYKDVNDGKHHKQSSNPMLYQISSSAILGYVRDKYYLNLSFELGYYNSEILTSTYETIWVSQAKLAFGYKFWK